MSQVPSQPGLETPPAQPAATPAPVAAPAAEPDPEYLHIPIKSVPQELGRDWHNWFGDAKVGRQAKEAGLLELAQELQDQGYDPKAYLQLLRQYQQENAAPAQPAQPGEPAGTPLTEERMMQVLQQFNEKQRSETEQRMAEQQAYAFEAQTQNAVLEKAGFKPGPDGKFGPDGVAAGGMFNAILNQVVAENLPSWASADDKRKAFAAPAPRQAVEEAAKRFDAAWQDIINRGVAMVAQRGNKQPDATLGGGPAGQQPPKDFSKMNAKERFEYLTAGIGEK